MALLTLIKKGNKSSAVAAIGNTVIAVAKGIAYVLNLPAADYRILQTSCHQAALALYGENQEITAYQKLFEELLK